MQAIQAMFLVVASRVQSTYASHPPSWIDTWCGKDVILPLRNSANTEQHQYNAYWKRFQG